MTAPVDVLGSFRIDLFKIMRDGESLRIQRGHVPKRILKKFAKSGGRFGRRRSQKGGPFARMVREVTNSLPRLVERYMKAAMTI